jgi:hypothetical protein
MAQKMTEGEGPQGIRKCLRMGLQHVWLGKHWGWVALHKTSLWPK